MSDAFNNPKKLPNDDFGMNMDEMFISLEEIYEDEQEDIGDNQDNISVELEDIYDNGNPADNREGSDIDDITMTGSDDYSSHMSIDINEYEEYDEELPNVYTRGEF